MIPELEAQASVVAAFRSLHAAGCFVLPNPWDVGSAVSLAHLGFAALATTSAGFAFSRGLPDEVKAVPRDLMLAHIREIVAATPLPVSADFQAGYADEPEGVADNVALCVATGVAGLSIEDATGDRDAPLYPLDAAVERVRAARAAIDDAGVPVVLTARCEAHLVGHPDPARAARQRLVAFAEAGADCLFAPGVRDLTDIASIVNAVAPLPVNVLVSAPDPGLSLARLAEVGVRRVSLGSALARVAWGAFLRAAQSIATTDTFHGLEGAASFAVLNQMFDATARPQARGRAGVLRASTKSGRGVLVAIDPLIQRALHDLATAADGNLPGGPRRVILNALGPRWARSAWLCRAHLALAAARAVRDVWSAHHPGDEFVDRALAAGESALCGPPRSDPEEQAHNFYAWFLELPGMDEAIPAAWATSKALYAVAYDDGFVGDEPDWSDADEYDEIGMNDTAFFAAWARSGELPWRGGDVEARRGFWRWWLTEAIPAAIRDMPDAD